MNRYARHPGFTLSEVLVVVAAMVLLTVLAVPATKKIVGSFESASGVRKVIAAALSNARAIAASKQTYAGVRFQQDLNGNQYMIFIIHDPADAPTAADLAIDPYLTGTGLANGFRALEGRKPVKLPPTVGVMDMQVKFNYTVPDPAVDERRITSNALIDESREVMDTTTFSVVFSPAGRLLVHDVRVRNLTGRTNNSSLDEIFNTMSLVDAGKAMLYQDDTPLLGLGQESSRNCFVVYDKKHLDAVPPAQRWTGYLQQLANLDTLYINPHTGELVNN